MKSGKNLALILSVIVLCTSASTTTFAETTSHIEDEISPAYVNAIEARNSLRITSSSAECTSSCVGFSDVVQISVEQTLQKFWGLWIWNDVDGASWSSAKKSNEISLIKTKSGLASGTYRLKSVFTLTNSSGKTETITIYSDEQTI